MAALQPLSCLTALTQLYVCPNRNSGLGRLAGAGLSAALTSLSE